MNIKKSIFAAQLFCGVMVAQQILILFVWVQILAEQH